MAQYASHANEMSLPIPQFPTLFLKPATSLADPWPAPTVLPEITQVDNTGDYESEMAIVIGRDAKDVSEQDAMDYVLGYTAANDVSSRTSQMNQSQWCFSKGFDTACPIGTPPSLYLLLYCSTYPMLIYRPCHRLCRPLPRRYQIHRPRPAKRPRRPGLSANVRTSRSCHRNAWLIWHSDLIFSVPKLVSFLAQGTTLPAGTIILTGTPPGVGAAKNPKEFLRAGDEFAVELLPHVGTLVTRIEDQI
jgi:2-keto-4-pentenoate hydratase/2-oxohepta-3-ene-1,7-dioic acid hydratase in catechol pathway